MKRETINRQKTRKKHMRRQRYERTLIKEGKMPTDIGTTYNPKWEGSPPRMSMEDFTLWIKWKKHGLIDSTAMWFDIGLGAGTDCGENITPELKKCHLKNTQLRADAIIEYPDHIKIVELRKNAGPDAIGRILAYKMLWEDDPKIDKRIELLIVTNHARQDTIKVAVANGISVGIV